MIEVVSIVSYALAVMMPRNLYVHGERGVTVSLRKSNLTRLSWLDSIVSTGARRKVLFGNNISVMADEDAGGTDTNAY